MECQTVNQDLLVMQKLMLSHFHAVEPMLFFPELLKASSVTVCSLIYARWYFRKHCRLPLNVGHSFLIISLLIKGMVTF